MIDERNDDALPEGAETVLTAQEKSAEQAPLAAGPIAAGPIAAGPIGVGPIAATPIEDDEEKPSTDFAQALAAFEREQGPAHATDPVVGQKVRGRIVSLGEEQSFIDFGGRCEGVLESRALRDEDGGWKFAAGDMLDLYVIHVQDQITLALSLKAEPSAAKAQIREAFRDGVPVIGKIVAMNAGGLEVDLSGLRGFCPFSQVESNYCADPSIYVGKTLSFLVTEMNEDRGNVVVSRRNLLRREEEAAARELIARLRPGMDLDGTVARLETFGAFVNLGGVDGLVHVSEIRHERTEHPSEALKSGDKVRVRVLRIDEGKDGKPRIALSMKASAPDPWDEVEERFWPGRRVRGLVVRLTEFGAFVNIAPGIDGLVHVSEAALHPVAHVKEVFAPQQEVEAVVRSVEKDRKRISLSVREALATEGEAAGEPAKAERTPKVGDVVEGYVAGIKPYGLFIDLPEFGHRARGLAPREETGERPGSDLTRRFAIGNKLMVEVSEVGADGRIKVSLTRAADRESQESFKQFVQESQPTGRAPSTNMAEAFKRAMEGKK
ncbi:MAG: S1 RNA-binding domain-containing protein [Candidatus Eisenbacteria bacterium]|nr:S1 RNA-binding domain-containing protein [Candidatus Eisenbacteria bacterium]